MTNYTQATFLVAILVTSCVSFSVQANVSTPDAYEDDDTLATATWQNATINQNGVNMTSWSDLTIDSSYDDDYFCFWISETADFWFNITFSHSIGDLDVYLYDINGNYVDSSGSVSNSESVSESVSTSASYCARVYGYNGATNYYNATLEVLDVVLGAQNDAGSGQDAGNIPEDAINLNSTNQTINGWLHHNYDEDDYYNISIPAGHGLAVSGNFPSGNYDYLYIYDNSLNTVDYDYSAPWTDVSTNGTNMSGQYVFIRVYTPYYYNTIGNYDLTITLFSTAGQPGSIQDDGRKGVDAGGSISSALDISGPVTDFTTTGWIDYTWDRDDYYSIYVPENRTIWSSLEWSGNSYLYFYLYSPSGNIIDSDYYYNPASVTANSTLVSGSTIFFRIYAASSSATNLTYTLTFNFSDISSSPALTQNDANSGSDAGNGFDEAHSLSGNGSYIGWVSDGNSGTSEISDSRDYYSVYVPPGFGIQSSLYMNNSSNNFDLYLYDSNQNSIDDTYYSSENPEFVQSGATNVSNSTVYVMVTTGFYNWINGGEGNYSLEIIFINISQIAALNQNDALSGGDAGDSLSSATRISTNASLSYWEGYLDEDTDNYDYYVIYVPEDHGIYIEMMFYANNFDLELYDDSYSSISYSTNNIPEFVSANNTYVGDEDVYIEAYTYYWNGGSGLYNLSIWIFTLDTDGDGFYDEQEIICGSDPSDNLSIPSDFDADGICDALDEDDDGDGVADENDSFPNDPNETQDLDGDNIGDNSDEDDDGDGWLDTDEVECNTDSLDENSTPLDTDSDNICDVLDEDDDNDGVIDTEDDFPKDENETKDTDGDNIGDNNDLDDDGDSFNDNLEIDCSSDPLDSSSIPLDTDSDGVCDNLDDDDDGDGITDSLDSSPLDSTETEDTDGDGIGDNADMDDDNDGYNDDIDIFPKNNQEWSDFDQDNIGDNADIDDDNDGWSDIDEVSCSSNQFSADQIPSDFDGDFVCDITDEDDDDDGYLDEVDMFPLNSNEWMDLDLDNIGDNSDEDDDGDGWDDLIEPNCGSDPRNSSSIPEDFDKDKICDLIDEDDDDDGIIDYDVGGSDMFKFDNSESTDNDLDGIGDVKDSDDDNDDWPDPTELICETSPFDSSDIPLDFDMDGTCDLIDPDDDNDGVIDALDAFANDPNEWEDRNNDGKGDISNPLTVMDHIKLNPGISVVGAGIMLGLISGMVSYMSGNRKKNNREKLVQNIAEETWDFENN